MLSVLSVPTLSGGRDRCRYRHGAINSHARLPRRRRLQRRRQPRHLTVQPEAQVTAQLPRPTALDGLVDRVVDAALVRVRVRVRGSRRSLALETIGDSTPALFYILLLLLLLLPCSIYYYYTCGAIQSTRIDAPRMRPATPARG